MVVKLRDQFPILLSAALVIIVGYGMVNGIGGMLAIIGACAFLFLVLYLMNSKRFFWHFLILTPFIPAYMAFQVSASLPVLTTYRLLFLLLLVDQLVLKKRLPLLLETIKTSRLTFVILIYSLCYLVTGFAQFGVHHNLTSLIGSISVIVEKVLLFYIVVMNINVEKKEIGAKQLINKILSIICIPAFILAILGIIEGLTSINPFHYLDTGVEGIPSNFYIRQGHLRINTTFLHALGYGLYLLLVMPIVFYQAIRKDQIRKGFYRILLALLFINMLMTYSRSTLIALAAAVTVLFLLASVRNKIVGFYSVAVIATPIIALSVSPYAYIVPGMGSIADNVRGLSDTLLKTHLVETDYGHNTEPFAYRTMLIQYALDQKGFTDYFGKGVGFIRTEPLSFQIDELDKYSPTVTQSVDNYYASVKLESGWIGLAGTVLVFVYSLLLIFRSRKHHPLNTYILIAFIGYMGGIVMVNELDTFKYYWVILAFFSTCLQAPPAVKPALVPIQSSAADTIQDRIASLKFKGAR